jgi:hypothetical protein
MSNNATFAQPESSEYPLRFHVEYADSLSRLLIFVKWLLAIPHFIAVYVLGIIVNVVLFIAFFAILFTKKFPRGLFDLVVNVYRWYANVTAYVGLMRDEYPPFSWEAGKYPVTFDVEYPQELNRFLPLIKWLLALPHYVVLLVLRVIAIVVWIISWFAILLTGRFPRRMFDFIVGVMRWDYRVQAYVYFMRDEYPPFSLK